MDNPFGNTLHVESTGAGGVGAVHDGLGQALFAGPFDGSDERQFVGVGCGR